MDQQAVSICFYSLSVTCRIHGSFDTLSVSKDEKDTTETVLTEEHSVTFARRLPLGSQIEPKGEESPRM